MKQIRVLAVAPYPKLTDLFLSTAQKFPSIQLEIITSNLDASIEHYIQCATQRFDVIISRGGTARLLKERLVLPVIEVKVSAYDMLRAIKLAEQTGYPYAIVGFSNITSIGQTLSDILQYHVEIHEIQSTDRLPSLIAELKLKNIQLIVGDVVTVEYAAATGLQNILITSSPRSIEQAFADVETFWSNVECIRKNDHIFRKISDTSDNALTILNHSGDTLYANNAYVQLSDERLDDMLRDLLPSLMESLELHLMKKTDHTMYSINAFVPTADEGDPCGVFVLNRLPHPQSQSACVTMENPDTASANVLFSSSEYIHPVRNAIALACQSNLPVLLQGQIGTEKSSVAKHIHCRGRQNRRPFITIHCQNLIEKDWKALVNGADSPLYLSGLSLFFENVHQLSLSMQQQLAFYLQDSGVSRRLRLFSSSTCDLSTLVSEGGFLRELYQLLNGIVVNMPSLNQRKKDIPALAALYINQFNAEFNKEVIGFEENALAALEDFDWVLNINQFQAVLRQLVLSSAGYYITLADVETVLRASQATCPSAFNIDLTKPLYGIEMDIIQEILRQESMNQTAAAKRLGISRSTLWRKLGG